MAKDDNATLLSVGTSVSEAIETMRREQVPAVAVVDDSNKLLGIFTNGDMRNYFLGGGDLLAPITEAMNPNPVCFRSAQDIAIAEEENPYIVYPLLNAEGKLIALDYGNRLDIVSTDELADVPLVIMSGGKGTRLRPYTDILPKALIPIGKKSISERIIDQFYSRGCREVWFILCHKSELIKAYFEGLDTDYSLAFLDEIKPLGTGGGISLLKGKVNRTFILSNCDILIDDDLSCAYHTHVNRREDITYICAMMDLAIPYGVIETDGNGLITGMREKPEYSFLVSTGVYIIEPWVIDLIKPNERIDFPDLVQRCRNQGGRVGVFPVPEDAWIDIGELEKMHAAIERYGKNNM